MKISKFLGIQPTLAIDSLKNLILVITIKNFIILKWTTFLLVQPQSFFVLGNFGTERHFLDGFVSPQILPALQNGARPAMFRRESNYSTTSEEA